MTKAIVYQCRLALQTDEQVSLCHLCWMWSWEPPLLSEKSGVRVMHEDFSADVSSIPW